MAFKLYRYLELFPAVCRQKFGRGYNFARLERDFGHLQSENRRLAAKDIKNLFDPANTPFGQYWPQQDEKALDSRLRKGPVFLAPLGSDAGPLILKLMGLFHNLGTAAILLRFVYPERFAVFSTPVIHLLQVNRLNTVDLYVAYCEELFAWKGHFRLPSVAQADMALWTFAEVTRGVCAGQDAEQAKREFDEDLWVQRRRVAQVVRPFLRRYGPLRLAQILVEEDWLLAGKIAAEEYERLLGVACRQLRGRPLPRTTGAAEALIDELCSSKGMVRLEDKTELKGVWRTRNMVVHPEGRRPPREEVERMIESVERICSGWEKRATA